MRITSRAALMMGAAAFVVAGVAGCDATETKTETEAAPEPIMSPDDFHDLIRDDPRPKLNDHVPAPAAGRGPTIDFDLLCYSNVTTRNLMLSRTHDELARYQVKPGYEKTEEGDVMPPRLALADSQDGTDVPDRCFVIEYTVLSNGIDRHGNPK